MPLVTTTEMFKKAYHGGYAIGAFNVNNMEIVQGITEAAQELKGLGINAYSYVSNETAHEWQTWRRSLYQFAQLIFK